MKNIKKIIENENQEMKKNIENEEHQEKSTNIETF